MKTREKYRIPQSTVDILVQDVSELCSSSIEDLKSEFLIRAEGSENYDEVRCMMEESVQSIPPPFQDISTQYKQTAYYRTHFDYVVSELCTYTYTCTVVGVN